MRKGTMSKTMNLQEQEGWKNQERAYEQGLLAGLTKSIVLCRSLQRSLVPEKNVHIKDCIIDRRLQWEILEQAMELIAEKIK